MLRTPDDNKTKGLHGGAGSEDNEVTPSETVLDELYSINTYSVMKGHSFYRLWPVYGVLGVTLMVLFNQKEPRRRQPSPMLIHGLLFTHSVRSKEQSSTKEQQSVLFYAA